MRVSVVKLATSSHRPVSTTLHSTLRALLAVHPLPVTIVVYVTFAGWLNASVCTSNPPQQCVLFQRRLQTSRSICHNSAARTSTPTCSTHHGRPIDHRARITHSWPQSHPVSSNSGVAPTSSTARQAETAAAGSQERSTALTPLHPIPFHSTYDSWQRRLVRLCRAPSTHLTTPPL